MVSPGVSNRPASSARRHSAKEDSPVRRCIQAKGVPCGGTTRTAPRWQAAHLPTNPRPGAHNRWYSRTQSSYRSSAEQARASHSTELAIEVRNVRSAQASATCDAPCTQPVRRPGRP
ncbi:hypothetical protein BEH93_27875 [Streptomyces sp. 2R]|nr:hypothetical protein BEH93_27875 [Streptomyces sp. 2R]